MKFKTFNWRWLNPIPLIGLTMTTWFWLASSHALAQEIATIKFDSLETNYHVGETVIVDLVEMVPPERTQPIDLWFAVLMPANNFIFFSSTSGPSDLPKPFKRGVATSETKHRLLEFAVPPNFEGNYTLYALYVETGKDPLTDGLEKVGRSNLASQTITFYEDSSKLPDYTEREFNEIDGLNTNVSGDIDISRIKFGDFNGDGKTDIYYIAGSGDYDDSHIDNIHLSHGDGTYTSIKGIKTWISDNSHKATVNTLSRIKFGDFNGDGKTDIYYIAGWTGNDDSHIDKIHLSHGDGTYTSIKGIKTWISDNGYEAAMNSISRIKFGDFNGDGKTDIYYIAGWTGNDDSHIDKIHLSHGDGTYTTIKGIKTWISDNGYEAAMNSISRIKFGDFNGDGSIDVYYVHGWGRVSLDKIHINSTK